MCKHKHRQINRKCNYTTKSQRTNSSAELVSGCQTETNDRCCDRCAAVRAEGRGSAAQSDSVTLNTLYSTRCLKNYTLNHARSLYGKNQSTYTHKLTNCKDMSSKLISCYLFYNILLLLIIIIIILITLFIFI